MKIKSSIEWQTEINTLEKLVKLEEEYIKTLQYKLKSQKHLLKLKKECLQDCLDMEELFSDEDNEIDNEFSNMEDFS